MHHALLVDAEMCCGRQMIGNQGPMSMSCSISNWLNQCPFSEQACLILWDISTGGWGSVQHVKVRHGSCFHRQKWLWSGLGHIEPYSSRSIPPLGYWDVWKGANKLELYTSSFDWLTESSLPCDRGIIMVCSRCLGHQPSELYLWFVISCLVALIAYPLSLW